MTERVGCLPKVHEIEIVVVLLRFIKSRLSSYGSYDRKCRLSC